MEEVKSAEVEAVLRDLLSRSERQCSDLKAQLDSVRFEDSAQCEKPWAAHGRMRQKTMGRRCVLLPSTLTERKMEKLTTHCCDRHQLFTLISSDAGTLPTFSVWVKSNFHCDGGVVYCQALLFPKGTMMERSFSRFP